MADSDKGFSLPGDKGSTGTVGQGGQAGGDTGKTVIETPGGTMPINEPTSSKGLFIGFGILVVLMIVFFFVRNAYANYLVNRKVEPDRANLAGWWLFLLLTALAAGAIFSTINAALISNFLFLGIVIFLALISFVLMLLSGRVR